MVELSKGAAGKIVCHARQHVTRAVVGLLLGQPGSDAVTDVVPLAHTLLALTAVEEAALNMIEAHAASQDLAIVGVYYGNARQDDCSVPPAVLALSSAVGGCIVAVDGPAFGPFAAAVADHIPLRAVEAPVGSAGSGAADGAHASLPASGLPLADTTPLALTIDGVDVPSPSATNAAAAAAAAASESAPAALAPTVALLRAGLAGLTDGTVSIADYDDHMDSLVHDWRNPSFDAFVLTHK
ncbi:uncharacterized protein AMSG_09970 [Thecamonas trahens ATCC 50062]|uniref:MPN domain-containing protein n=1 Tax=Thecamonas trahens ATCC 50062 TaxID=461836 RepID=A0A0L0DPF3_THETB|nr:hypothetical protein AMSG_09970 [Thecamonas trahens ATCC 50062]KNC54184.1 hypothetical protein AMSG_09970 [Thecamonas trahens ATCC 50062]|eukprot:XP_013754000.1 hypothetical protein AMSG_09970 [Thecamonas trahens ATCC 50062]